MGADAAEPAAKRARVDAGAEAAGAPQGTQAEENAGAEGAAAAAPPSLASAAAAADAPASRAEMGPGLASLVCVDLALCVRNLPTFWNHKDVRKELAARKVAFASAKKQRGNKVAFVHFDTAEQREAAMKALEGAKVRNRVLELQPAKRRFAGPAHATSAEEAARGCAGRDVRDSVTPLWREDYADQLANKGAALEAQLKRLTRRVRRECSRRGTLFPAWTSARSRGGMAVAPLPPRASPVVDGYRNKLEFSVGLGVDALPCVGFQIGAFRDGLVAVAPGDAARNVPKSALLVAAAVQDFVRASGLPVWDRLRNKGVWRDLMVREAHGHAPVDASGGVVCTQLMAVMQVSPAGAKELGKEAELEAELVRLGEALAEAARAHAIPLACAAWWRNDGCSNVPAAGAEMVPLALPGVTSGGAADGVPRITERVCGLEFEVTPSAFFQVNTHAAQQLYEEATRWALGEGEGEGKEEGEGKGKDGTLVFDVCCGSGAIGLTVARRAAFVVGLEINERAVVDARANARANGIENAEFVAGRAECTIGRALGKYMGGGAGGRGAAAGVRFDRAVAIVDPPRGGLHADVLRALRRAGGIERLVYVSCNVESLVDNAVELCTPDAAGAGASAPRAFKPVRAVAHDLFPHTRHCETVMLFERDADAPMDAAAIDAAMGDEEADAKRKAASAEQAEA